MRDEKEIRDELAYLKNLYSEYLDYDDELKIAVLEWVLQ